MYCTILQCVECSVYFAVWTALHDAYCASCDVLQLCTMFTVQYVLWILQFCGVDYCNRAAEAALEMQQKIPALKHSWSHDDAGAVERWGGAEADIENICVCVQVKAQKISSSTRSHNAMMLVLSDGAWGPQNW